MRRRLCSIFALAVLSLAIMLPASSFAKGWEPVRTDVSGLSCVTHDNEVEIRVAPGHVIVETSLPIQIKVFTILGQVVSNETLQAGVSRLPLSHGVYIVKAGDLTCKIAV